MSDYFTVELTILPVKMVEADLAHSSFTNPLFQEGADPWITVQDNEYVYTHTTGNNVTVWTADTVIGLKEAHGVEIWTPPDATPYSSNIWAPEIHFLDDKWYVYFAADDGHWENHRMYVLESATDDPQGDYRFLGKIADTRDEWAIDGTILQGADNNNYFIWSGSTTDEQKEVDITTYEAWVRGEVVTLPAQQSLYIARMANPWTIEGEGVMIATPTYDWEMHGIFGVNEGPTVMENNGNIKVLFSASHSWTDNYCLGQLEFEDDDYLNSELWIKHPKPVFESTDTLRGPGHAAATKPLADGSGWLLYHVAKRAGSAWARQVHAQPYTWKDENSPLLGRPLLEVSVS